MNFRIIHLERANTAFQRTVVGRAEPSFYLIDNGVIHHIAEFIRLFAVYVPKFEKHVMSADKGADRLHSPVAYIVLSQTGVGSVHQPFNLSDRLHFQVLLAQIVHAENHIDGIFFTGINNLKHGNCGTRQVEAVSNIFPEDFFHQIFSDAHANSGYVMLNNS